MKRIRSNSVYKNKKTGEFVRTYNIYNHDMTASVRTVLWKKDEFVELYGGGTPLLSIQEVNTDYSFIRRF